MKDADEAASIEAPTEEAESGEAAEEAEIIENEEPKPAEEKKDD